MDDPKSSLSAFWRFLRSTPRAANLFALSTLAIWVLKALWLDFVPEPFSGAYELGKIIEGILSAILAGWVFYLFFALLPEASQKAHLAPFVLRSTAMIAGDASAILREVNQAAGTSLSFSKATEPEITDAFTRISTASNPQMVIDAALTPATWLYYLRHQRVRTEKQITGINEQSRYVEPALIAMVLKVSRNPFFMMCEQLENVPLKNTHFGFLGSAFHKYLLECRNVAKWHDAHLAGAEIAILPDL